jgi:hypothetical protein
MAQNMTAAQWLQKWGNGLNGAATAIKAGVSSVSTAPGAAAAAKQDKMLSGVTQAITSGKWAKNVSAVSLQSWQNSMTTKGIANIASGVTSAQANKVQKIQQTLDQNHAAVQAVSGMPTDTADQRMQKALAFMQVRRQIAQQGS